MYRGKLKGLYVFGKQGPRQGWAEQVSKSRQKILATMYKHFSESLEAFPCIVAIMPQAMMPLFPRFPASVAMETPAMVHL